MLIYNATEDRYKVLLDPRRGEHALKALGYHGWQSKTVMATWAPVETRMPVAKAEKHSSPFRAAAFLGNNGTVYETGPYHDIEAIPQGIEVSAEGFVDLDGRFFTREEAAEVVHLDHAAHSEELELKKSMTATPDGALGDEWLHGTSGAALREALKDGQLRPGNMNAKARGWTTPLPNHVYLTRSPEVASKYADWKAGVHGHPEAGVAVVRPDAKKMVPDEDWLGEMVLHGEMQHRAATPGSDITVVPFYVRDKHPLWEQTMAALATHPVGAAIKGVSDYNLDRVAHQARIGKRVIAALKVKNPDLLGRLTAAAPSVAHEGPVPIVSAHVGPVGTVPHDLNWKAGLKELKTGQGLGKGENNVENKSKKKNIRGFMTDISDYLQAQGKSGNKIDHENIRARLRDHRETLEAMAHPGGQHPAFQAAAKLAGHPADAELRRQAELDHGDDVVAVALASHGLDPDNAGLRMTVEAACQQLRLGKSEMNVAVIPRVVEPGQQGADHMCMVIRAAYGHNLVFEVRLGGRHSAGTAVAYDQEDDRFWLLKPGSARVSPAAGVSETPYSQSRREAAFNQAARSYKAMQEFYPECWLLLLDGQEVACMGVMGPGFKPAQRFGDGAELLEPHRESLDIYRWAWWDWVLGNPDSHGGNILITEDGRVALIDHGSALAGPSFNPAGDPRKSFIPYYLRVFSGQDFSKLDAEQRYHGFPHPTPEERETLNAWMRGLGDQWKDILQELVPEAAQACVRRADALLGAKDPADALLRAWAGVDAQ